MHRLLTSLVILLSLSLQAKPIQDWSPLWLRADSIQDDTFDAIFIPDCDNSAAILKLFTHYLGDDTVFSLNKRDAYIRLRLSPFKAKYGKEGFKIIARRSHITIKAAGGAGLLYGSSELFRSISQGKSGKELNTFQSPHFSLRMLNHWDNMDGTIEQGFVGLSLWDWEAPSDSTFKRLEYYALLNASVGINAVVLNNVNADPRFLKHENLEKAAAIADILRPYNIRVFLSANLGSTLPPSSTPERFHHWGGIGTLPTADPLDEDVCAWWNAKADEIYSLIPDFGGFLVKAGCEDMPGPGDYGRTHADGANMLARALAPHNGLVLYRAFVYQTSAEKDRAKRAYLEFMPLDGQFDDNVIIQIKNGPIDFQPAEPPSSLFGAMKKTKVMAELQITQEYTGQSSIFVYLPSMWKEFFRFQIGEGLRIADLWKDGKAAIAGVANTGNSPSWCGNPLSPSNWYAFGRLAWDPYMDEKDILNEWICMSWGSCGKLTETFKKIMIPSWSMYIKSQTPYGIPLTVARGNHFKADFAGRNGQLWSATPVGIGYDRSASGSAYTGQYTKQVADMLDNPDSCPEHLLLFFHFIPWDRIMNSGKTLAEELFDGLSSMVKLSDRQLELLQGIRNLLSSTDYETLESYLLGQKQVSLEYLQNAEDFFVGIIPK